MPESTATLDTSVNTSPSVGGGIESNITPGLETSPQLQSYPNGLRRTLETTESFLRSLADQTRLTMDVSNARLWEGLDKYLPNTRASRFMTAAVLSPIVVLTALNETASTAFAQTPTQERIHIEVPPPFNPKQPVVPISPTLPPRQSDVSWLESTSRDVMFFGANVLPIAVVGLAAFYIGKGIYNKFRSTPPEKQKKELDKITKEKVETAQALNAFDARNKIPKKYRGYSRTDFLNRIDSLNTQENNLRTPPDAKSQIVLAQQKAADEEAKRTAAEQKATDEKNLKDAAIAAQKQAERDLRMAEDKLATALTNEASAKGLQKLAETQSKFYKDQYDTENTARIAAEKNFAAEQAAHGITKGELSAEKADHANTQARLRTEQAARVDAQTKLAQEQAYTAKLIAELTAAGITIPPHPYLSATPQPQRSSAGNPTQRLHTPITPSLTVQLPNTPPDVELANQVDFLANLDPNLSSDKSWWNGLGINAFSLAQTLKTLPVNDQHTTMESEIKSKVISKIPIATQFFAPGFNIHTAPLTPVERKLYFRLSKVLDAFTVRVGKFQHNP